MALSEGTISQQPVAATVGNEDEEMPTLELETIAKEDAKYAQTLQEEEDKFEDALVARRHKMTGTKACLCTVAMYVCMIAVATMFALVWIILGVGSSDDAPTWVRVYNYNVDAETSELYAVAFHWAISKFTLSSVEPTLTPQNSTEKVLDLLFTFFAVFLLYPLLGAMIALVSKLLPLLPSAEATRKELAQRLLVLGGLIFVQWLIFAGVWVGMPGSRKDLVVAKPGADFSAVFRKSGEKDFAEGLNWSLCQFSFGSVTILPPTYEERLVSIFVQLVGLWTMYPLIAATIWTVFRLFPQSLQQELKTRKR